jgi:predicted restriction endonuclease
VYSKVLNFRFLDPRQDGKGLSAGSETDKAVWSQFFDAAANAVRSDGLDDEFRRVWQSKPQEAPKPRSTYAEFGEAPDDDPAQLRTFLRTLRRGQPAFRRNLLAAYESRCCISGWAPETVLEAAHIEEHSKSGLNSIRNGLLLRSDLHALFDEGLLRIEPEQQVVILADELRDTPYWELNGRPLRRPVRGEGPSPELLAARWRATARK